MNGSIQTDHRNDEKLRGSFDALAQKTFGLTFEPWYQNGFWTEAYVPHSMVIDGAVVSNVSANLITGTLQGKVRRYIQLGTVMTAEEARGKGYAAALMQAVMKKYEDWDGMFLYANDSVLDFYPKFGFAPAVEHRFAGTVKIDEKKTAVPVSMTGKADWAAFLTEKGRRRSNGVLQLQGDGLLMFYLTQFMKEAVYYIETLDAYVIAEVEGERLTLYDVFSTQPVELAAVWQAFGQNITHVALTYTPARLPALARHVHQEPDTTLFVCGDGLQRDMDIIQGFPELAHA